MTFFFSSGACCFCSPDTNETIEWVHGEERVNVIDNEATPEVNNTPFSLILLESICLPEVALHDDLSSREPSDINAKS